MPGSTSRALSPISSRLQSFLPLVRVADVERGTVVRLMIPGLWTRDGRLQGVCCRGGCDVLSYMGRSLRSSSHDADNVGAGDVVVF